MKIRIGEMAKRVGCPVVTIRFYEKEGLLAKPERNGANYRVYGQDDLERLRFILHCRKHGIGLPDIRKLLYLKDHPQAECAFVHELIERQLAYVEEQLTSLHILQKELRRLQTGNVCDHKGHCPILTMLESAEDCIYCKSLTESPAKK